MFLKDSSGNKSASFTFALVGFIVVTIWLAVSIVQKVGSVEIRPFNGTDAAAYLLPILSLYFGRRYTNDKITIEKEPDEKADTTKSDSAQ